MVLNKTHDAQTNLESDLDGNNEELVRLDNDDEQIIITTQHKAKGLEYDILFCPFFKSGIKLDGAYDFNYRRPFFSNFRDESGMRSELIMDTQLGSKIIANDNKEAHRLNYVALTRAKQRLYIYLKQPTITKVLANIILISVRIKLQNYLAMSKKIHRIIAIICLAMLIF